MSHHCSNSTPPPTDHAPERCPLCGRPNDCQLCAVAAYKGPCWCASVQIPDELIARVPGEARNKACICRKCVSEFHHAKESGVAGPKIRPGDFYFDNGLMVFTADYHLRRGYCCGNDCRHCPYQPQPASDKAPARVIGLVMLLLCCATSFAATFTEDFSANPVENGWRSYGASNLFAWDSTNQNLRVTWDSSKTNSYFHHPLGTILASDDDFSLSFEVGLTDYAIGTTPGKFSTFEIAIGFLNLEQATQTNFFRGAGINATYGPKNLVEFNFFPAFDSFLPTLGQAIVSTNNVWRYNDSNLLDLTPGEMFQVNMNYVASLRTLTTTISYNAVQYGQSQTIAVPPNFDFRVATLSISSYSDAIQPPPAGSILAHGTVDNFRVTVPEPPVQNLSGAFVGSDWQTQFLSRTNWLYALERTTNFSAWSVVATSLGNGGSLALTDANPPLTKAFYRVRANRP